MLRKSAESSMMRNTMAAGFNFGTIKNFKKTEGINDKSIIGSFREWTGMPETKRNDKAK